MDEQVDGSGMDDLETELQIEVERTAQAEVGLKKVRLITKTLQLCVLWLIIGGIYVTVLNTQTSPVLVNSIAIWLGILGVVGTFAVM